MSRWMAGVLFGGAGGIVVGVFLTIAWALRGASKADELNKGVDLTPYLPSADSATTQRANEAWERMRRTIDDEDLDHVPDEWTS